MVASERINPPPHNPVFCSWHQIVPCTQQALSHTPNHQHPHPTHHFIHALPHQFTNSTPLTRANQIEKYANNPARGLGL